MTPFDLAEMQSRPFPRATPGEFSFDDLSKEEDAAYVSKFLPPRQARDGNIMCVGCGSPLSGLLTGTFEWGIAHGEGHCYRCGYPARMYHFFEKRRVAFPLQWHPDDLVRRKQKEAV